MNKKKEKNTPGYFARKKAEWEGMRLWNGEELCRLDWIFSFLILAVLFVLCAHSDVKLTGNRSFLMYEHFTDFYQASYEQSGGYWANYLPSTFLAYAIWNLPLYLTGHAPEAILTNSFINIMWYKLLPVILYFITAQLMYRIGKEMGFGEKKSLLCKFAFLVFPMGVFSQFIFSQYDIFTVFFMVLGFYLFLTECNFVQALRVLSYNQITLANAVGVKRTLRSQSFKGYMKAEERNVRAAGEEEIIETLQACTNSRDQLLILLLAETGFRIGEILGVDYSRDIDYQNHTVGVYFRDDNENEARAKNAEYRKGKISDDAFDFLMHYLSEYRELLQYGKYLFINISGKTAGQPLNADSVYAMLERAEKKTGVELTPHMLRRYFAVTRWNAGWPLELISQALGHKHLDTTIKYLGILDDKLLEASREFYAKHSINYGIGRVP